MAWFSKGSKQTAEDVVSPVTIQRVARVLEEADYKFEVDEARIQAYFAGFATVIEVSKHGDWVAVYSWSTGLFGNEELFTQALEWANAYNEGTMFGVARPYIDADGDTMLRVDTTLFTGSNGASDAQLRDCVLFALGFNNDAMEKYAEAMGLVRQES